MSPDGRLWVADSGTAAVFATPVRRCPAKIVAFDINHRNPVEVYRCNKQGCTYALANFDFSTLQVRIP